MKETIDATARKYKTRFWALLIAGVGIAIIICANLLIPEASVRSIIVNIGGVIITTSLLSFLWDVAGKHALTQEVLGHVGLKQEIVKSGITSAHTKIGDVPMQDLISKSRDIQLFVAYGSTWLSNNETAIQALANRRGRSLTAIFPDPTDEQTVLSLASRFTLSPEQIREKIKDGATRLLSLQIDKKATISIRFYKGQPTHSFYKFDDTYVAVLYNHQRKRADTPILITKNGSFADFIKSDFSAILNDSYEIKNLHNLDSYTSGTQK